MSIFNSDTRDAFFERAEPVMRRLREQVKEQMKAQVPSDQFLSGVTDNFYEIRPTGEPTTPELSFHVVGRYADKVVTLKCVYDEGSATSPAFLGLRLQCQEDIAPVWQSREFVSIYHVLSGIDRAVKELEWKLEEVADMITSEWARFDAPQKESIAPPGAAATKTPLQQPAAFDDGFKEAFYDRADRLMKKMRFMVKTQIHSQVSCISDNFGALYKEGEPPHASLSFYALGNVEQSIVELRLVDGQSAKGQPPRVGLIFECGSTSKWISDSCSVTSIDELDRLLKEMDLKLPDYADIVKAEWYLLDALGLLDGQPSQHITRQGCRP